MASFINKNLFKSEAKRRREEDKVLNWSELPVEHQIPVLSGILFHLYRITEVEVIEDGPYGTSYILFLVDRDNTKVKAWASKKLIRDLQRKEEYDIPYIVSLGQKPYGKGKTINLYDLAFEKGEEIISLLFTVIPSSSSSPPARRKKDE